MGYRIRSAVAIDDHRVEIAWSDGLTAAVDFSDCLRDWENFAALRNPRLFNDVRIGEYGVSVYWLDPDGNEIDICPDVLRAKVDPAVAAWIAKMEQEWAQRAAAE